MPRKDPKPLCAGFIVRMMQHNHQPHRLPTSSISKSILGGLHYGSAARECIHAKFPERPVCQCIRCCPHLTVMDTKRIYPTTRASKICSTCPCSTPGPCSAKTGAPGEADNWSGRFCLFSLEDNAHVSSAEIPVDFNSSPS